MDNNKEHNDEDLRDEAPTLFGIPKTGNFKTPEGYFDENPSRVMDFIEMHEARERREVRESAQVVENTPSFIEKLAAFLKPKVLVPALAMVAVVFTGVHVQRRGQRRTKEPLKINSLKQLRRWA